MKLDSRYTNISNETSFTGDTKALSYMPMSLKDAAKIAVTSGVTNARMTTIAPDKDLTWQEGVRMTNKVQRGGALDQDALISRLQQSHVGKLVKITEREGHAPIQKQQMAGLGASLTELTQSGVQFATAAASGLTAANAALNQNQTPLVQPIAAQEEPSIMGIPVKWAVLGAGLVVVGIVMMKGKKEGSSVLPIIAAKKKRRKK